MLSVIARNRRREALRIGAEGCEENDLTAPTLPNSNRELLLGYWYDACLCARHAFGTTVYEETGNLAVVMKVMGHADVRTSMRYQHPILDPVRKAIDQRNSRHNPRHREVSVQ